MDLINTKIILKKRPDPEINESLFDLVDEKIRDLKENEFLIEVHYLSVDPAMRGWISKVGNYSEPVKINGTMRSLGVGKIIASKNNAFLV